MFYIGFRTAEFETDSFIVGAASIFLPVNIMIPVYLGNAISSLYQTAYWYEGQDMLDSPIIKNIQEYIEGSISFSLMKEYIIQGATVEPAPHILDIITMPVIGEDFLTNYYHIIGGQYG